MNVVNQLLTELDGFDSRKQVYVVGATNRLGVLILFLVNCRQQCMENRLGSQLCEPCSRHKLYYVQINAALLAKTTP